MQIGPYTVVGELGRGGMGVVFRCRAPAGGEVALKLLRASSPQSRARFDRERRLLVELAAAPGFVPILDSGEAREGPYLVMPILPGGTLRDRLRRGPLPIQETVDVGLRLARALAKAHELGIVHRDVKPENVLFDTAGVASLADLGLAKHFASEVMASSQGAALSRAGALCGTAGYMAPEQAHDARSVGPAADVFALGAVLYECLAGWAAFEGRTLIEVLSKIERESPPPLANARPETPPWLVQVIERSLARKLDVRFADAGAVARALERRALEVGPRSSTRAPLGVGLGAVAALALAGAAFLGTRPAASPPPAPSPSPSASVHDRPASPAPDLSPDAVRAATPASRRRLVEPFLRRGALLPLEDARAIARLEPPLPEASALLGIALLVEGKPGERAEAIRLIGTARQAPEVKALHDVARSTDSIVALIERALEAARARELSANFVSPELIARVDALDVGLAKLASWPAPVVNAALAPLLPAARGLALSGALIKVAAGWATLAPGLAAFPRGTPGGWMAPPDLYTAIVLVELQLDPVYAATPSTSTGRLIELARSCSQLDPGLAAMALCRALQSESMALDLPKLLEQEAAVTALLTFVTDPADRSVLELELARESRWIRWALVVWGRPEDRALALVEGRAAAEKAYAVGSGDEGPRNGAEAEELIRFCLEAGDVTRVDLELVEACRDRTHRLRSAMVAEVSRVQGHPETALAELNQELPDWSDDQLAVAILCELDLGKVESARQHWRLLDTRTEHGTHQNPGLTYLRCEAIALRLPKTGDTGADPRSKK